MKAVSKQACCIGTICLADLVTTIWWANRTGAAEANPLMAGFLAQGIVVFVVAKLALTAGPLGLLEWARPKRPKFVTHAMNIGAVAYLGVYTAGVVHINKTPTDAQVNKIAADAPEADLQWIKIREHLRVKKHLPKLNDEVVPMPQDMQQALPAQNVEASNQAQVVIAEI